MTPAAMRRVLSQVLPVPPDRSNWSDYPALLRKVSDRVDAWLGEGRAFPDKGHWQDLASELGVRREAHYREIARRR